MIWKGHREPVVKQVVLEDTYAADIDLVQVVIRDPNGVTSRVLLVNIWSEEI